MLIDFLLIIIGIVLLVKGSELLVDSVSSIAAEAGIPIMVIGLSAVALGTSLPELVVGVDASLSGAGGIALGNVVGSNIVNVCIVIGAAALIKNIIVSRGTVRTEIPMTIAGVALLTILSYDGMLDMPDGVILLASSIIFFYYVYRRAKSEGVPGVEEKVRANRVKDILMMIIGVIMAYAGGTITVDSTISVASGLGISPYLIAVTLIAFGTNLPEIATSAVASLKGRGDLILGNGLGSININTLLIVGVCAIINPIRVSNQLDILISLVLCVSLIPLLYKGYTLSKREGAILVLFYAAYIIYKVATQLM